MITPQPQPAAYWIALLDELTGGSPLTYRHNDIDWCWKLDQFIRLNAMIDNDIFEMLELYLSEASYICSGQSVIDTAVELEDPKNDHVRVEERLALYGRLEKQVKLYKRSNGIKD